MLPTDKPIRSDQDVAKDRMEVDLWLEQNKIKKLPPGWAMAAIDGYKPYQIAHSIVKGHK